ncbi:MAG: hypothetical protein QOH03_1295, partial [Kribbellaceae bacterium]|nr:hypothetical protein [Kribbellaceae bacterium]
MLLVRVLWMRGAAGKVLWIASPGCVGVLVEAMRIKGASR